MVVGGGYRVIKGWLRVFSQQKKGRQSSQVRPLTREHELQPAAPESRSQIRARRRRDRRCDGFQAVCGRLSIGPAPGSTPLRVKILCCEREIGGPSPVLCSPYKLSAKTSHIELFGILILSKHSLLF